MTFEFHMEIDLAYHNAADYQTDEWDNLMDEYEEKFRCFPGNIKELPCKATDAHGVSGGLCFTFGNSEDVEYAHSHILETEWFASVIKNHPKFYFVVPDLNEIWGLNEHAIRCSIDNTVNMDSEWNQWIKECNGLPVTYDPLCSSNK